MQRRAVLIAAGIVVVVVGGLLYYWSPWSSGAPEPEPEEVPAEGPAEPAEPVDTKEPSPAAPPLPALDESDGLARDLLADLSDHRAVEAFLSSDQLIRTFVVVVVNVSNGENPAEHVPFLAPEEDFQVVERDGAPYVDPAGYDRYDPLAEAFTSVDLLGAVRAYRRVQPLLDRAYRNLGYPEGRFADALDRAMVRLIDTPIRGGEIELVERTERYEFADPELEALSPPEKQLLRLGPQNAGRIKTTLRELRELMYSEGLLGS